MMCSPLLATIVLSSLLRAAWADLSLQSGYSSLRTKNFKFQLVQADQLLVSLKSADGDFDFLPFDYLNRRARDGQHHWGDITYRYRTAGSSAWIDGNSTTRKPITKLETSSSVLAAANLAPTLPAGPLSVTREWYDESGDLGLRFTLGNTGNTALEIGSLGFPAEFNSIFTQRTATQIQDACSLTDPYIGLHAGHLRVAPVRGTGAALVVTPVGDTPLEAYRNLAENNYPDTAYGSQVFEGLYEWQVLSKAYVEREWAGKDPWNPPTSRTIQPNQSLQFALRFSLASGGVRDIDATVSRTGTPVAVGVPGYIIPRGEPAQLRLRAASAVQAISVMPADALTVTRVADGSYLVTPSNVALGRARVTVKYEDGKLQTIHYYVTKPGTEAIADLGRFLTTIQWFNDTSDPFGRAPSPLSYDYEARAPVAQDARVWIAGLSDEGGAGSFLAATVKQAVQPNAAEIAKLEQFVDKVLWKTVQTADYAVRKSIFFYEPGVVSNFRYSPSIDWRNWWSWNKAASYATDRAYNYVHVAASYWALYRVARAYPELAKSHTWEWYLDQAYRTITRMTQSNVGYNRVGLMGETVFGEILLDLTREGQTAKADDLTAKMRSRATQWDREAVPFGSEMAWDSTGQEGVYYWCKYFGYTNTMNKALNTVLGFMPAVPHWGWNGNARRYWDNIYGGKLQRIERQIHHYGSGLNSQVLLSGFRSAPNDTYLLRVGHAGVSGPLSNINAEGFASASFHSWPDTLKWDGYSGDYGPGFLGMALGTGTYVAQDANLGGLVAFGGVVESASTEVKVRTTDPVRRRIFIAPLSLLVSIDAGIIASFTFTTAGVVQVQLTQLPGVPKAKSAVVWLEGSSKTWVVEGAVAARKGFQVALDSDSVTIRIR